MGLVSSNRFTRTRLVYKYPISIQALNIEHSPQQEVLLKKNTPHSYQHIPLTPIKQIYPASLSENIFSHFWVPAVRLVSEMHASLQEVLQPYFHESCGLFSIASLSLRKLEALPRLRSTRFLAFYLTRIPSQHSLATQNRPHFSIVLN